MGEESNRFGEAVSDKRLKELKEFLGSAGLPFIPQNASVAELNRLLEYIAGELAYAYEILGGLKNGCRTAEREYEKAYGRAYVDTERHMTGASITTIKMVVDSSPSVSEAKDALIEKKNNLETFQGHVKALEVMELDIRKLITSEVICIEHGL